MKFTIFGIIWFFLLCRACMKNSYKKIIFLVLLSTIFQCNSVLILKDISVGPLIISSIVLCIYFHCKTFPKIHITKKVSTYIFRIILLGAIIISLCANGESLIGPKLFIIIQFIIYCLTSYIMIIVGKQFNKFELNEMLTKIIIIVMGVGILQYLIFLRIIPKLNIFTILFYNEIENNTIAYHVSPNLLRLFSTFQEPSYCAAFLVGAFYYLCYNYQPTKRYFLLIVVLVIEIILTKSTTAYVSLIICGILFLIIAKKFKVFKLLIPMALVAGIFAFSTGLIHTVIINKMNTGSALERSLWNLQAIERFYSSPIYGIGYKNSRASSIINCLLAELGILGLFAYILFILNPIRAVFSNGINHFKKTASWFFIPVVVSQIISIPDLTFCVFWLGYFIINLSENTLSE